MAVGTIKTLIDRYEETRALKERLTREKAQAEKDFKLIQEELAAAISEADMADVQDGEYTYTPGVRTRYSFLAMDALQEAGLDKFAAFEEDERLRDLVVKYVNANAMQGLLREIVEHDGELPEAVAAVLNTYDDITISRTKKDTIGKNKVRDALRKRRAANV